MKATLEDGWRKVSKYLDEVLDLEGEARQAWLDGLEARAPADAAEVRRYLRQLAELDKARFLDAPAVTAALAAASFVGQRFGAYTLVRPLGHGGMGTVWLADRNDGRFEGQAAVKLLNTSLIGHPSAQRFVREGNVLAKLRHPNIAHLLDAGIGAGGQPYLILEYVRGDRIDHYCERHKLSIEQRIALFLDVLTAVAHAHSNLIVHRDLKPANILVSENGVVKLLDFGVAALLTSSSETDGAPLTHHFAPGLTPGYAAPEQLLGEAVTTATDVYSLGLVLFVLLAGQHPRSPEEKAAAELMKLTLETEAPRPSEIASDEACRRSLRGDLDNIVSMALRRNPAERYITVELFALDLRRYLALEPVSARAPSFRYLAAKFMRRHRGAVIVTLTMAVILISSVIVTTSKMVEARRQRDEARYQTRRADAFSEFLTTMMQSDSGPNQPRLSFFERTDLGIRMINQQYLAQDPQFAGRILVQLASNFRDNGEESRAIQIYKQAYEIGRRNHDPELMASAQCNRAYGDASAGTPAGALERVKDGESLLEQITGEDSVLRAECLKAEARLQSGAGHYESAVELLQRAIDGMDAAGATHTETYVATLTELGGVYLERRQLREVLQILQRIGEFDDRNGRGGTANRLVTRQNVAAVLTEMGEIRGALAEREVIQVHLHDVESPGQEPFAYAINYALVLLRMDRPTDSMRALDGTLARARQSGNQLVLARALLMDGSIRVRLGRLDEAEAVVKEALSIATGDLANRNYAAQGESLLAQVDLVQGYLQAARVHCTKSLEYAGYHTNKPERWLGATLLVAARVALADHAFTDAERFTQDALAIGETVARGPETSADVGEALLRLAQARIALGGTDGAAGGPGDAGGSDTAGAIKLLLERAVRCLSNGLDPNHPLTIEARKLAALQSRL